MPDDLDLLDLTTLRTERRRLVDEHARLAWLRRLVRARADLEVARLTGVRLTGDPGSAQVAAVRTALALAAQPDRGELSGPELLVALAASDRALSAAVERTRQDLERATAELVHRYAQDPAGCLVGAAP